MNVIKIPLSKIKVQDRARTEFGEIGDLAESIRKLGLLQPLVVETDIGGIVTLRAGERRLRAITLLQWDTAPCVLFENLTALEKLEIELEENIKRKNFSWQEEVLLKDKINEELKRVKPNWTAQQTADKIGIDLRHLQSDLALAKTIKSNPNLIKDEKDKSNAYRKVCRDTQIKVRELEVQASTVMNCATPDQRLDATYNGQISLQNINCFDLFKSIPDDSIDLIITDPPYGVNLKGIGEFGDTWNTHWDDTKKSLDLMLPELFKEFKRILKNGSHFYIFMPFITCDSFMDTAEQYLSIQKLPLIWNKVNRASCLNPFSLYAANYEMVLYGWKDVAKKFSKPGDCVLTFPSINSQKIHPTQKPVELIEYFINQSSIPGELVLDPFAGSGTTAVACINSGRKFVGSELEKDFWNVAVERLLNYKKGGNND